jgi:protein TonB
VQSVNPAPAQSGYEHNEFESELPAMAASAEVQEHPIAAPVAEVRTKILADDPPTRNTLPSSLFEATQPKAPAAFKTPSATPATSGAASAPAPARESTIPIESKPAIVPVTEPAGTNDFSFGASSLGSSPSFSALDDQDSTGSGGNKKLLVIAAVVIVAAAMGYFGFTKLGKSSSTSQPASAPQTPITATSPAPASSVPSASPLESAASPSQPAVSSSSKPSASISTPSVAINTESEVVTKKIAPAIVVKSNPSARPPQAQSEDATPQVPNPLSVATTSNKSLSGLVSSVPTALPTAALGTLRISQGVSQGLLIKRVQPRYPQTALSMRVQGAVLMEATINKEGNISNLKVISGDVVLAHAASEAVKQWRYKPYYLNGEPVEIQTQITVNFKLPN